MKQVKYLLFTLICIFIFPLISHGECDYQRKAELSRLAGNVKTSYSYTLDNAGNPQFVINITNLSEDIYLKQKDNFTIISGVGEKQIEVGYDKSISYDIYSNDPSCKDEFLLTKYIEMPVVNSLADSNLCKNNSNFKYCQRWGSYSIDYNEFQTQLSLYKKNIKKNNYNSKDNILQIFVDFFNNNKFMIIFFGIITGCLIVYYIFYKKKM